MSNPNSRLFMTRMSHIEELKALDERIGSRAINQEERAQIDKINQAVNAIDVEMRNNIRKEEQTAASERHDSLVGVGKGETRADSVAAALGAAVGVGTSGETRSIEFSSAGFTSETRDLLTSTSGASIMTEFMNELMSVQTNGSPIWEYARKVQTDHTRTLEYPNISAFGSAVWLAEAAALSEDDPTLTTIQVGAYKVGQIAQVSYEAEHEVSQVLDVIARDLFTNITTAVDARLATGTGSSQVQGITVGFTGSSTIGGIDNPTADELIQTFHALPSQYRRGNCVWAMNDATVSAIRLLKDTTNQYMWQSGLAMGQPDTLLGFPVITSSSIATAGSDAKIGVFYNADQHLVRSSTLRFERSADVGFANDLISYRALQSIDARVLNPAAGVVLTNENA